MRRFALCAIAALSLVGCTTSPPTSSTTVNAQQVIYSVLTELYCAVTATDFQLKVSELQDGTSAPSVQNSYFASADNWVVGVDLYLSASVEASVSPSLSLLGPFNLAKALPAGGTVGSFTSALGGTYDQTRTNLREYKLYIFLPPFIRGKDYFGAGAASTVDDWGMVSGVHCSTSSGGAYDKISGNTYLVGDWASRIG
jgi:hypothetical protein